jgi:hypothetical protein
MKKELKFQKNWMTLMVALTLIPALARAQDQAPEMADMMRSNGKIYVVVFVLATIFAGLSAYLIRLDLKIRKLEKHQQNH